MILITGAAGFIGSCLARSFNRKGRTDLVLVDDFSRTEKSGNLKNVEYEELVNRDVYLANPGAYPSEVIFHIGARTDTTEFDVDVFNKLNLSYSKELWSYAVKTSTPFIYASSAATYGDGTQGFDDNPKKINTLKPLNPYGQSKQDFDVWAMEQKDKPPFWVGLKFFNVYGPNEYHKGRMASVVFHTFNQIRSTGSMKLFESHRADFENGEQSRDFIYIKDVLEVLHFWHQHQKKSGIYNLGTGEARSFNDLANAVFKAMNMEPKISYIPTPQDLRETYQYYTCAEMKRTLNAGYKDGFHSLEEGVTDYVKSYLVPGKFY